MPIRRGGSAANRKMGFWVLVQDRQAGGQAGQACYRNLASRVETSPRDSDAQLHPLASWEGTLPLPVTS